MMISAAQRKKTEFVNLRDGEGTIYAHDLVTAETLPKNLKICSFMRIKPGDSIGPHPHEGNTEIYHCLEGEGYVLDGGEERLMRAGDSHVTNGTEPHALYNRGTQDLVILAIIVFD